MQLDDYRDLLPKMELRERILIGMLLLEEDAPRIAIKDYQVHRRYFWFAETRAVFVCIEELYNQGVPIDPGTVCDFLIESGQLREISGLNTINDYLLTTQVIQNLSEDYTLHYLLNLISAQAEMREMCLLTERYDFSDVIGEIDEDDMELF